MSEYTATIEWERAPTAAFTDKKYSRGHEWKFDGGITVPASASPHGVPVPYSVAAAVDPEEAFVAALSSCHLLWFLSIAAKRGFVVDRYSDDATGTLAMGPSGKVVMTRVLLRPHVTFGGDKRPTSEEFQAMHHEAHDECFIANSVRTDVVCEPVSA
ncbi:MAG: OsmC family protein [Gemmatimonadaceae bacterium]|nr:OsmC family protein [Gemmatimonadaceae bacterium]